MEFMKLFLEPQNMLPKILQYFWGSVMPSEGTVMESKDKEIKNLQIELGTLKSQLLQSQLAIKENAKLLMAARRENEKTTGNLKQSQASLNEALNLLEKFEDIPTGEGKVRAENMREKITNMDKTNSYDKKNISDLKEPFKETSLELENKIKEIEDLKIQLEKGEQKKIEIETKLTMFQKEANFKHTSMAKALERRDSEYADKVKELDIREQSHANIQKQLEEYTKIETDLKGKLLLLETENRQEGKSNQTLVADVKKYKSKLEQKETEMKKELENQFNLTTTAMREKDDTVNNLKLELGAYKKKLEEAVLDVTVKSRNIGETEYLLESVQGQLADSQGELLSKARQISECRLEITEAKNKEEMLSKEVSRLNKEVNSKAADMKWSQEILARKENKLHEASQNLTLAQEEIRSKEESLIKNKEELWRTQTSLASTHKALMETEAKLRTSEGKLKVVNRSTLGATAEEDERKKEPSDDEEDSISPMTASMDEKMMKTRMMQSRKLSLM